MGRKNLGTRLKFMGMGKKGSRYVIKIPRYGKKIYVKSYIKDNKFNNLFLSIILYLFLEI